MESFSNEDINNWVNWCNQLIAENKNRTDRITSWLNDYKDQIIPGLAKDASFINNCGKELSRSYNYLLDIMVKYENKKVIMSEMAYYKLRAYLTSKDNRSWITTFSGLIMIIHLRFVSIYYAKLHPEINIKKEIEEIQKYPETSKYLHASIVVSVKYCIIHFYELWQDFNVAYNELNDVLQISQKISNYSLSFSDLLVLKVKNLEKTTLNVKNAMENISQYQKVLFHVTYKVFNDQAKRFNDIINNRNIDLVCKSINIITESQKNIIKNFPDKSPNREYVKKILATKRCEDMLMSAFSVITSIVERQQFELAANFLDKTDKNKRLAKEYRDLTAEDKDIMNYGEIFQVIRMSYAMELIRDNPRIPIPTNKIYVIHSFYNKTNDKPIAPIIEGDNLFTDSLQSGSESNPDLAPVLTRPDNSIPASIPVNTLNIKKNYLISRIKTTNKNSRATRRFLGRRINQRHMHFVKKSQSLYPAYNVAIATPAISAESTSEKEQESDEEYWLPKNCDYESAEDNHNVNKRKRDEDESSPNKRKN
jgi:hypothetical protein